MTEDNKKITAFLQTAGWQTALRSPLAGDASARCYHRLRLAAQSAILMDAPLGGADDPAQFLFIAAHLAALGLSPPRCLAQDLSNGLLLLEDLGDGTFTKILAVDPAQELPLYAQAVDVLHHIQRHAAPSGLPDLLANNWADAALLSITRYRAAIADHAADTADLQAALSEALTRHANGPRVMILRDYHAENLMHLPLRSGIAQVGLLDFQLAQMGQPCYDLVSLLQDARRDVTPATTAAMIGRAMAHFGGDAGGFTAAYATFGAQRALRILGIFAQLCTHQGRAAYVPFIPRVWGYLQQNLSHPALRDVAKICDAILPPPNPAALATLRSRCASRP